MAAVPAAWAAMTVATARLLYGRWRGRLTAFAASWETAGNGETAARALASALFWPLVLLLAAVMFRPPPTEKERAEAEKARAAEAEEQAAHIRRLERELGIGGG